MRCIYAREQVEEQMTSGAALFRTLSSSLIWMEFISVMTALALYFCVLLPPQLRAPHAFLQYHPPESHTLEFILFQDNGHIKSCHMNSGSYAAVPFCHHMQLWTAILFGLPVDPLHDIPSLPKFSFTSIPWEQNPATEGGTVLCPCLCSMI